MPTLAVCATTGRIAFGDEDGYHVVHPDGRETFCSVPPGVVSLAFATDTPNVWVGTRAGELREMNHDCEWPEDKQLEATQLQSLVDYSRQPKVFSPAEPMWPISFAYGGFGGFALGCSAYLIWGISPSSDRNAIFAQAMTNGLIGLAVGAVLGLTYGVLVGNRKL